MTTHIYYRVSTEKQDFEMQFNAIKAFMQAKDLSYELSTIYKDFGISGTTAQRPDYQRLLAEVKEHDIIMVYEFSRLWRDLEEQSRATKMLMALGVRIISVADGELNSISDTLLADIKGSINQFEARRLKDRTNAGIAAKKARISQGLDVWKPRGRDKKKRNTDGYRKEQERRRALKALNH
jgi:DNA invertase Pin-like site-specific DNA recombinase